MKCFYALVVVLTIISRLSGCKGGSKTAYPENKIPSMMSFDRVVGSLDVDQGENMDSVLDSFVKACQKMKKITRGMGGNARLLTTYKTMKEATRPIVDRLDHQVAANHGFPSDFDEVDYGVVAAVGEVEESPVSVDVPSASTTFNDSMGSGSGASGARTERGLKAWFARLVEENARAPQLDDENSAIINRSSIVTAPLKGVTSRLVPTIVEVSETLVAHHLVNATTAHATGNVSSVNHGSPSTHVEPLLNATHVAATVQPAVLSSAVNESAVAFTSSEGAGVALSDDACCPVNYTTVETGVRSAEATLEEAATVDEPVLTTALPTSEAPLVSGMNITEPLESTVTTNATMAAVDEIVGEVDHRLALSDTVEAEHGSSDAPVSRTDEEMISEEALYLFASDEGVDGDAEQSVAASDDVRGPLDEASTSDDAAVSVEEPAILMPSNGTVSSVMTGADVVIEEVKEAEGFDTEWGMGTSEDVASAPQIEVLSSEALVSPFDEERATAVHDSEASTRAVDAIGTVVEAMGVVNETLHGATTAEELEAVPAVEVGKSDVPVAHVEEAMCLATGNNTLNGSVDEVTIADATTVEVDVITPLDAAIVTTDDALPSTDDEASVVCACGASDLYPCTMSGYGVSHNEEEDSIVEDVLIVEADAADERSSMPLDEAIESNDAVLAVPAAHVEYLSPSSVAVDAVAPIPTSAAEGVSLAAMRMGEELSAVPVHEMPELGAAPTAQQVGNTSGSSGSSGGDGDRMDSTASAGAALNSSEAMSESMDEAAVPEDLATAHEVVKDAVTMERAARANDSVEAEVSELSVNATCHVRPALHHDGDAAPCPSELSPCDAPVDVMTESAALNVSAIVEMMNMELLAIASVEAPPSSETVTEAPAAMPAHQLDNTGATTTGTAGNASVGVLLDQLMDCKHNMSVNASALLEDSCPLPVDYYKRPATATAGLKDVSEGTSAVQEEVMAFHFLPPLVHAAGPTIRHAGTPLNEFDDLLAHMALPRLRSPAIELTALELAASVHVYGGVCLAFDNKSLYECAYGPMVLRSAAEVEADEGRCSLHMDDGLEDALDAPSTVAMERWFNISTVKSYGDAATKNGGDIMRACGSSVAHYSDAAVKHTSTTINQYSNEVSTAFHETQQSFQDEYERAVKAAEALRFEQACVSCMCRSALGMSIANETASSASGLDFIATNSTWAEDACAMCNYWAAGLMPSNTSESSVDCGHAKLPFAVPAGVRSWYALALYALCCWVISARMWFDIQRWNLSTLLAHNLMSGLWWLGGKACALAWWSGVYTGRFALCVFGVIVRGRAYAWHRFFVLCSKIDLAATKEVMCSLSIKGSATAFADGTMHWLTDLPRVFSALFAHYIFGFWALWPTCVGDLAEALNEEGAELILSDHYQCLRWGRVSEMGGFACSICVKVYGLFKILVVGLPPVGLLLVALMVLPKVCSGLKKGLGLASHKLRLPRRLPTVGLRDKLLLGALALFLFTPTTSAAALTSSALHMDPAALGQCLVNSSFANTTVLLDPLSSVLPTVRFGRVFVCHAHKSVGGEANVLMALLNFRLDCQLELQFIPVSLLLLIGMACFLYRRLNESCRQMGISMLDLGLFPILLLADTLLSFLAPDAHIIQLQAHVRKFLCRRRFLALRSKAITLQSWARMLPHRALFSLARSAAVTIQHAVRRYLSRSYRRARLLALTTFQAIIRRRFTQRQYQTLLQSVRPRTPSPSPTPFTLPFILLLQRFARRCLAHTRRARWLQALTRLQALARGRLLRQQYLRTLDATLCIQCYMRRFLVSQHTHLLLLDHSAVTLQATVRGYLARLCFLRAKRLASCLQPLIRRYLATRTRRTFTQSVITIQAAVRGYAARLYVAMVRSRKQRNKMRAMVRAWCVQTAGVDGGAVRRFWQDMASAHSELLAVPLYERLLQRLVTYHHPKLRSLEDDLALSWGTNKGRARGERSRQRHLTDACWGFLLEARTREGVIAFDMESLRRARLGYLDYRLRGHANELKGMKPWSAEGAIFLSVTVAAWKREWRSLTGGYWPMQVQQYRW